MTHLIDQTDRPELATAGHRPAPDTGADRAEQRAIVEDILRDEALPLYAGAGKTARDTGKVGKIAADKLTDDGKRIEDEATHREKEARDEKHRKDNGDKARKDGASASEMWHHDAAHAFADGLDASL